MHECSAAGNVTKEGLVAGALSVAVTPLEAPLERR